MFSKDGIVVKISDFFKQQILDSSKLKEFKENNFRLDENGRQFS